MRRMMNEWEAVAVLALIFFLMLTAVMPRPAHADDISLSVLGQYQSGIFNDGGAEIVAYDPSTKRLFVVNAGDVTVDVLDLHTPSNPVKINTIDATLLGGGANSVAVAKGILAVAIEAVDRQQPGLVAFYRTSDLALLKTVTVGALPDMVTFTPDGKKALVANEGEPNDAYTVDPEGSVSIINLSNGVAAATVKTASFAPWNGLKNLLIKAGVRIFGPNATVAQDVEPEYITTSDDGLWAWVTLQESNAIALISVPLAKVLWIAPLGTKDHNKPGNELDPSDRDGGIHIATWPVKGFYLPDAIDSYTYKGQIFLVTANEGDARDYDGFGEEARVNGVTLDPSAFPNAATLQANANLGRLRITNANGDTDGDGDFDRLYSFGGRSFSIRNVLGGLVYDSGADFENITAAQLPTFFNSDNAANNTFDGRSANKGPEPEGVVLGEIKGRTYAFVLLERIGGVMVYDVTNPHAVSFKTYENNRNFLVNATDPAVGDLGPEAGVFIPAKQSPNGKPLLVVGNEISGTTTIYEINVN